jgi:hypothetical protein
MVINNTPAKAVVEQNTVSEKHESLHLFAKSMGVVRRARANCRPPLADEVAKALRNLHRIPPEILPERWIMCGGSSPPSLPDQRATWLANVPAALRTCVVGMLEEDSIWTELGQWRKSALAYASAVQLWGRAAGLLSVEAWPPSQPVLNMFAFFFKNGDSLSNYVSHIRSVLALFRAPLGVLQDSTGLLEGARKLTPLECRRVKQRATADQTRRLAQAAEKVFYRKDVADSWIVARHFCLRFGAEVVPLQGCGTHSRVDIVPPSVASARQVSITLFDRKLQKHPVVVTRRCICELQGSRLCGVCVLHRRWVVGPLFPSLTYADGLALVKAAAAEIGLNQPLTWGTHAFRRGWADEALRAGGPAALFYSGGWKGVAAFGYVAAQSSSALAAAEWLVDFSESESEVESEMEIDTASLTGSLSPLALTE